MAVSPGRVIQLFLESEGLDGDLPWKLGRLDVLVSLWSGDNRLTGEIPAELDGPGNLMGLRPGGNMLTGCISTVLNGFNNHDLNCLGLEDCETPKRVDSRLTLRLNRVR